jgi:hypothetical protein
MGIWDEAKFKALHLTEEGKLLVGTEFGEVYQIETEPEFKIVQKWGKEELQGTSILFIESYRDAILVGTELGLHILKSDENRFWTDEKSMSQRV